MQQTENYKLNLIETSDPFSPVPLNENTQKLDATLAGLDAADGALAQRVQALEADKVRMIVGSYVGDGKASGDAQIVRLGVTPKAVLLLHKTVGFVYVFTQSIPLRDSYCSFNAAEIVEGGFQVVRDNHTVTNYLDDTHHFIAFC